MKDLKIQKKIQHDKLYDWLYDNNSSWGFDMYCKLIEKGKIFLD